MGDWEPVYIRRKSDGKYANKDKANGPIYWTDTPKRSAKNRAKAYMVIRIDLGDDLDAYELIPRDKIGEWTL